MRTHLRTAAGRRADAFHTLSDRHQPGRRGVQSSVMALMAGAGAFDRTPDCAIFADTKWEPPSIYAHLDWLEGQLRTSPCTLWTTDAVSGRT